MAMGGLFAGFGVLPVILSPHGSALMVTGPFLMVGAGLLVYVGRQRWLRLRAEENQRASPDKPWLWERWDATGADDEAPANAVKHLAAAVGMAVFLAPFHYVLSLENRLPWLIVAFIGVFDLIVAYQLLRALCLVVLRLRHGTARLRFRTFPYWTGEPLVAHLEVPRLTGFQDAIKVRLACLEDRWVQSDAENAHVLSIVTLHEETVWAGRDRKALDAPVWRIKIDVKPGALPSRYSEHPKVRWVLEATLERPRFRASFHVPVYARPAAF